MKFFVKKILVNFFIKRAFVLIFLDSASRAHKLNYNLKPDFKLKKFREEKFQFQSKSK